MKLLIPTCDASLFLLPLYEHLFNKYDLGSIFEPVVLGFTRPEKCGMEFVSMADKQVCWSRHIYDYLNSISDEYVAFTLEDFLPVSKVDADAFRTLMAAMLSGNVGRADLTWDLYANCETKVYDTLEDKPYSLISCPRDGRMVEGKSLYRITTQPATWRRDYLMRFLEKEWTPWNFEIDGSVLSANFPEEVIGICDATFKHYPTKWTPKGAISRAQPGKFNCLGMDIDTIKECIELGFIKEDDLIWGMWVGNPVTFHGGGGYDFTVDRMPFHPASPTNWEEWRSTYA